MKKIFLSKGQYALVDNEDFKWLKKWKWMCSSHGYAVRSLYLGGGRKNAKRNYIRMHRVIMKVTERLEIDHINRNRLDNRKINLRIVNRNQNQHNRNMNKNNTSGFTGVSWHKLLNRWQSRITVDSRQIRLGYFLKLGDAAEAYNLAKLKYHG